MRRKDGTELPETNYPSPFHSGADTWMVSFCWPLTVFIGTPKLFSSRFTSVHSALEALRLCAVDKSTTGTDIDIITEKK